jgi:hypothetical protein
MKEAWNPTELTVVVWQLEHLSAYKLVPENNIARNFKTLVALGLDKSFDEIMGAAKRKGGEKKRGMGQVFAKGRGGGGEGE